MVKGVQTMESLNQFPKLGGHPEVARVGCELIRQASKTGAGDWQ